MAGLVEISVDEHRVAVLRLNRPEARNALSAEMREEIAVALERLDADPDVGCIVLAGSGEYFAAGADIKAMAERPLDAAPDPAGAAFWARLAQVETPTIAAVAGYALGGGCELALACDMIVAEREARFGQPEIRLGIIPGGGGTQRLTRVLGKQRAMELVLTGRSFDAETAAGWGLVNRVAEPGRWLEEAISLARKVAERPPLAARLAKRAVQLAEDTGIVAGLRAERELFERAMATEDRVEGMRAFLEKRDPEFRGR
ncbi:MAG TPA: enoyl-CoA hydratase-related protein [Solirubrobacterales bacterium]|jgi:enoyl-CoA hydratase/carnithine racemase|nr:enoyl-CoA hydratase-related protein [Solirubrobacterales bacterium]